MSEFKILVDVELNTGGLQAELDKAAAGLKLKINDIDIAPRAMNGIKNDIENAIKSGLDGKHDIDIDQKSVAKQVRDSVLTGIKSGEKKANGYRPSTKWLGENVKSFDIAKDDINWMMKHSPREEREKDRGLGVYNAPKRESNFKNLESLWREYAGITGQIAKLNPKNDIDAIKNLTEWRDGIKTQIQRMMGDLREGKFLDEDGNVQKALKQDERTHLKEIGRYNLHALELSEARMKDAFRKNLTNDNFNELQNKLREINSTEVKLRGMDEMSDDAVNARKRLQELYTQADKLRSENWDNFSTRQKSKIAQLDERNDRNIDAADAHARTKKQNKALNERIKLQSELHKSRAEMRKYDAGSDEYNRIKEINDGLKTQIKDLDSVNAWTKEQLGLIRKADGVNARRSERSSVASDAKKAAKETKDSFKELLSIQKQIGDTKINLVNASDEQEVSRLVSKLKDLESQAERTKNKLGKLNKEQSDAYDKVVDKQGERVSEAQDKRARKAYEAQLKEEEKIAKSTSDRINKINDGFRSGKIEKDFRAAVNSVNSLDNASDELRGSLRDLGQTYRNLNDAHRLGYINDEVELYDKLGKQIEEVNNKSSVQKQSDKIASDLSKLDFDKEMMGYKIDNWANNNTKAIRMYGRELDTLKIKLKNATTASELLEVDRGLQSVNARAKLNDVDGLIFGDRLKSQAKEYASYIGVAGLAFQGISAVQAMARNVLEVDTAMTGLYRVTDLTSEQYDQLYDNMIASSKEYGSTLTDTINATSDWVRAGFDDPNEALGLADVTAMYQHVSDLDYDEASKNLITAYNGFKNTLLDAHGGDNVAAVEHVADVYNELDNQFSVTSAGLGEGISRAASSLQVAGNTFEESTAMVGAIAEVTQDPTKAGNALKTISMRLRGMKGELEELGEDSEGVENITKMQGKLLNLTKGKVNIFGSDGEFRSTYDILNDIAEVYDELDSKAQGDILETVAGKHACQYAQKCA